MEIIVFAISFSIIVLLIIASIIITAKEQCVGLPTTSNRTLRGKCITYPPVEKIEYENFLEWKQAWDSNHALIPMSFATFLEVFSANSNKITITDFDNDKKTPCAVFYDRQGNGLIDAQIIMKTRKDAKALCKWYRDRVEADECAKMKDNNIARYHETVACTEAMLKDIKAQNTLHQKKIEGRIIKNKEWRNNALQRQAEMQEQADTWPPSK